MADITLDVQRLVACVDRNDDAEYERLYDCKNEVRDGKRLDNFGREDAPCDLQVGQVSSNEDDSFRDEEPCTDSACAKDDVHDDHGDGSADNAWHDKVTDWVNAHGRKSVNFGIDNHAANVGGQRGSCTACNEERREDGTQFADDDHHDEGTDVV